MVPYSYSPGSEGENRYGPSLDLQFSPKRIVDTERNAEILPSLSDAGPVRRKLRSEDGQLRLNGEADVYPHESAVIGDIT